MHRNSEAEHLPYVPDPTVNLVTSIDEAILPICAEVV
jgi:hypothetical protein